MIEFLAPLLKIFMIIVGSLIAIILVAFFLSCAAAALSDWRR
jgi:hypothetical protein